MTVARTPAEIVGRIENPHADDWGGFAREVLVPYLPYEHAQPYLKDEVTEADWTRAASDGTPAAEAARSYYEHALGKIENHRGISADVAVTKLREFAWLLGCDDVVSAMDEATYESYGAPKVKAFAAGMGYEWPDTADLNRMADSLPCTPDCMDGCAG